MLHALFLTVSYFFNLALVPEKLTIFSVWDLEYILALKIVVVKSLFINIDLS